MSLINSMKLVSAQRATAISPVISRRNKLTAKLYEQIQLATAQAEGKTYEPSHCKIYINKETGARTTKEVAKRLKQWWWINENGKVTISVRYGAKTLELAKGKNAIEVDTVNAVLPTLQVIKQAVEKGELDTAIEAVSRALKTSIKK